MVSQGDRRRAKEKHFTLWSIVRDLNLGLWVHRQTKGRLYTCSYCTCTVLWTMAGAMHPEVNVALKAIIYVL